MTSAAGGTVDASGTSGISEIAFSSTGAGITINGNSTWTGVNGSYIIYGLNPGNADLTITIAPSVTLTSGLTLQASGSGFRVDGGGTLYLTTPTTNVANITVSQAKLRVDDVMTGGVGALGSGVVTLDGGTLQYSGSNATLSKPIGFGAGGGTLEVSNVATTLIVTSPITGSSALTKSGPGVLILNNSANLFLGGLAVSGGRLDVSDDAQLGGASPTVNPAGDPSAATSMARLSAPIRPRSWVSSTRRRSAPATSSTRETRPRVSRFQRARGKPGGLSTAPGATQFTLMPWGRSAVARLRVSAGSAAFDSV